ncbi:hypothetical protein F5Y19DRAFT_475650 [Xylariaceae sp. FL1651]|nr:hypothetical protein F5Y19DRAFT_475650 [Xylariaceae sp. FL1651]
MYPTGALFFLLSGLSAAAPQIPVMLSTRDTFTPPKVLSTSFSGNGCPQGATAVPISSSWEHFAFTLPGFSAAYGASSPVSTRTVNCQGHLNLGATPGWQFTLKDLWSTGYLELEGPGVTLTQYVTVYFSQDAAQTTTTTQSISSPANATVSKNLALHAAIPASSLVWSPCSSSGIMNVNFRMAFTSSNQNSRGYYGPGKNSSVTERWGWTWRRC